MLRFLIIVLGIFKFSNGNSQEILENENSTGFAAQNWKLMFVQALWRHGDRAALTDLYPITEQNWTIGGGGFGELTPIGMEQLNRLGGMFRKRYIDEMEFLSTRYASREVHIRSTDVNRTIISAMALTYGLFPAGAWNIQGVDYPTSINWQQGFTFVPIHVDGVEQCEIGQKCEKCARMDELTDKATKLEEVKITYAKMLAMNHRVAAFYNVTTDIEKFWWYPDTWKCQRNWFNDTLYRDLDFYNEELYEEAQEVYAPLKRQQEGYYENDTHIDGIDIALETQILKFGPLINEIYNRAEEKMDCEMDLENCTSYTKNLKFYGYSSHDMVIYGLLVALGIPDLCKSIDGWPDYASAMSLEFYSNPDSNEQFFKVLYRDNSDSDLEDVTSMVPVCNGAQFCTFENFKNIAKYFKPEPDHHTRCQTSLDETKSSISDFSPFSIVFSTLISILLFKIV